MANFFDWLKQSLGQEYSSNTQHLSDLSDQQIQKFYDDRAKSNLGAYNENFRDLNIDTMRNGDASWSNQNSSREYSDFAPRAYNAQGHPMVYEFSYLSPSDAQNIDGGGYTRKKGAVFLSPDWNNGTKGGVDSNGNLYGDNLVYEAVLEDGTTLNADQFRDFITGNYAYYGDHDAPVRFNRNPLYSGEQKNSPVRQEALDFYTDLRNSYGESAGLPDPYRPSVYWDKSKRRWMVNR